MKKINLLFFLFGLFVLCGCRDKDAEWKKIEYIPFQSEKDGRWGLISTDGKVLFEDEFKECPTMGMNGRFFVQNSKGEYEIYTTDEKPEQVGTTAWKEIALFSEDVTPAVEKGKGVVLIDRDGEQVADLSELAGKKVESVQAFFGGLAIFETTDGLYGAIDTDGKVVVQPEYCQLNVCQRGKMLALEKKYKDETDEAKKEYCVLDDGGQEISRIRTNKFSLGSEFSVWADVLYVEDKDGRPGLIDEKGEWVVKPSDKVQRIRGVGKDYYVYKDDDAYGLRTFDGETLIRAKHDEIYLLEDEILAIEDESRERDKRCALYDVNGERIGEKRFRNIFSQFLCDGYAVVEIEEDEYGFIDKNGEILDLDNVDVVNISLKDASYWVHSDLVDYDAMLAAMNITAKGLAGVDLGWNAERVVNYAAENTQGSVSTEPSSYTYQSAFSYEGIYTKYSDLNVKVNFDRNMADASYEDYSYRRYFVPASTAYIVGTEVSCSYGKLDGKSKDLFKAMAGKLKKLGSAVKENSNALVARFSNGNYAVVVCSTTEVSLVVTSADMSGIDISEYENNDNADIDLEVAPVVDSAYTDTVAYYEEVPVADSVAVY